MNYIFVVLTIIFQGSLAVAWNNEIDSRDDYGSTIPPIINPEKLGEHCEALQAPCNPPFSQCIDNICRCKSGYVQKPGSNEICLGCTPDFSTDCYFNEQCECSFGSNATCRNYLCRCKNGFSFNPGTKQCSDETKPKILIGHPCSTFQTNCVGYEFNYPKADCTQSGICSCKVNYISSSELDYCLPVTSQLGQRCWEDQQCKLGRLGRLSECIREVSDEKICNCTENAVYSVKEDKCVLVADGEYNIDCSIHDQCTVKMGHSYCLDRKCVCLPGKKRSWNGICE